MMLCLHFVPIASGKACSQVWSHCHLHSPNMDVRWWNHSSYISRLLHLRVLETDLKSSALSASGAAMLANFWIQCIWGEGQGMLKCYASQELWRCEADIPRERRAMQSWIMGYTYYLLCMTVLWVSHWADKQGNSEGSILGLATNFLLYILGKLFKPKLSESTIN